MTSPSTGSGASRLREAANEAVASLPRSAPHGAALAGMCFAALLMASSCAMKRDLSAFAPVESAVAVRADSTDSLIGKTIIVAWRERTEMCSLGQESASERCESDESVNEGIIAIESDGATFLSDDGSVIETAAHHSVSSPSEGIRSKSFVQGNEYIAATWLDMFDVQNRSRTVYAAWGDTCTVKKPDTLRSSGSAGQIRRFEVELLSCEVISGPYSP